MFSKIELDKMTILNYLEKKNVFFKCNAIVVMRRCVEIIDKLFLLHPAVYNINDDSVTGVLEILATKRRMIGIFSMSV